METIEILDVILEPSEINRIEHYFEEDSVLVSEEVKTGVTLLPFIVYRDKEGDVFLFDRTCLWKKPTGITTEEWNYLGDKLEELLEK